jgi:hypothetical protein
MFLGFPGAKYPRISQLSSSTFLTGLIFVENHPKKGKHVFHGPIIFPYIPYGNLT